MTVLRKTRTWVDENYEHLFPITSEAGQSTWDGSSDPEGSLIRSEVGKKVLYTRKRYGDECLGFYIKIEEPPVSRVLEQFIRKRLRPRLKVSREFELLGVYRQLGIPAAEAVAIVEHRVLGVPVRGLIVQKEVVGNEFTELLRTAEGKDRSRLLLAYGKLVGELHSKGMISSTVRVTDIICVSDSTVPWQEIELVVIDREHGSLVPEQYDLNLVCEKLDTLLVKYAVYVKEPEPSDLVAFLSGYIRHLSVPEMPDKRLICDNVRRAYLRRIGQEKRGRRD